MAMLIAMAMLIVARLLRPEVVFGDCAAVGVGDGSRALAVVAADVVVSRRLAGAAERCVVDGWTVSVALVIKISVVAGILRVEVCDMSAPLEVWFSSSVLMNSICQFVATLQYV